MKTGWIIEAEFVGPMHGHREEHSLGWDIHLSMNLQESRPQDRIVGPSIGGPSSLIARSTCPHYPTACKLQSMTVDTPEHHPLWNQDKICG